MAVQRSSTELFLTTPNIFTIKYVSGGDSDPLDDGHPFMNRFKPCMLSGFNVNYTPANQYMTYDDAANTDDGTCTYVDGICETCEGGVIVDNDSDNDGLCDSEDTFSGCIDDTACNYNSSTTLNEDNSACTYLDGICDTCDCHVFHQYTLLLEGKSRDQLVAYLNERKIPSMIYYPVPGHRQKMFGLSGNTLPVLPVTDWLTERVVSLPIHTELDQEQLSAITKAVLDFVG